MAEDVSSTLVQQTKDTLSKYIRKPPLHEKFLKKPPFKFLQDIIKSVIKETKFMEGKFSDEEFENAKDRETKVKFLDKLIVEIEAATGKKVAARPSKIVAGLDVNKTLELLILLGHAIEKNGLSQKIEKKSSSQIVADEKKTAKPTEKIEKDKLKEEEKKISPRTKIEPEKADAKKQVIKERKSTVKKPQQTENRDSKKSTVGRKTASKTKEDVEVKERKPLQEKRKSLEKSNSLTKEDSSSRDSQKLENDVSKIVQGKATKTKQPNEETQEKDATSRDDGEIKTISKQDENAHQITKTLNERSDAQETETKSKTQQQAVDQTTIKKQEPEIKNLTDSAKETKKLVDHPKTTNQPQLKPGENAGKDTQGKFVEKNKTGLTTFGKPSNTNERKASSIGSKRETNPQVEAPVSVVKDLAKPIKLDGNRRVSTPDVSYKQRGEVERPTNIFTESHNADNDADDMFIPETQYVTSVNESAIEKKGEFEEQGQLVSQIIDTKKQLENNENGGRTKIQWEESDNWRRKDGEKEVGGVRKLIQELTKNSGPLGRLVAGLQEDIDEMMQELTYWRQINSKLVIEIKREKELTEEAVKPLKKQLEELEKVEYIQVERKVQIATNTMYDNEKKIQELIEAMMQ